MSAGVKVTGPDVLPCIEKCEVPEGHVMAEVPVPRHAWGDVLICPNEGCGRAWLCLPAPRAKEAE